MFNRLARGMAIKRGGQGKRKKDEGESSRRGSPKQPRPRTRHEVDYDSDPEKADSHYDPAAKPFERDLGFDIPTRRMLRHIQALLERTFENTRLVCMNSLDTLGVADDLVQLTASIGFQLKFWSIREETYRLPTLEFLSSLRFKVNEEENYPYLKFRLSNATHRLKFSDLETIMGFDCDWTDEEFQYRHGWGKLDFWKRITGIEESMRYKARLIQHPVIRITQRVLAQTIFARGESSNQMNDAEGHLLDSMLDQQPIKPHLTRLMAQHWVDTRNKGRTGGNVTMGAYVTLIARALDIQIDQSEVCTGPKLMSLKWFSEVHFIKIVREDGDIMYKWKLEGRPDIYLPYRVPVDHRPHTWLIPANIAPQPGPAHAHAMHAEEEPPQHASRGAQEPQPPPAHGIPQEQPPWFTQFLNLTISTNVDAREGRRLGAQNAEGIARLNERVDVIENNQMEWAFRYDHGYWQHGEGGPSSSEQQSYYPQQDIDPFSIFTDPARHSGDEPARLSGGHDFSMP